MNPPLSGSPAGGPSSVQSECSTEEMYQHLVTSLGMDADLPRVAQQQPLPPLSYQHLQPLEDGFATMGISGIDSIYNYNRPFSGEFQHRQWLGQQNPVAWDAASAFSSNPMVGGGYQYLSGPLAYRAQPAPSNGGFLSCNYNNYSWRGSNQGSWSPVCPCGRTLCLRCNDLVTLATNSRTSKVLQERIKTMNRAQIGRLFSEFKNKMEKMMTHPVANFVSLNLLEVFTEAQIDQILRKLCSRSSALIRLCEDNRGCVTVITHQFPLILLGFSLFARV